VWRVVCLSAQDPSVSQVRNYERLDRHRVTLRHLSLYTLGCWEVLTVLAPIRSLMNVAQWCAEWCTFFTSLGLYPRVLNLSDILDKRGYSWQTVNNQSQAPERVASLLVLACFWTRMWWFWSVLSVNSWFIPAQIPVPCALRSSFLVKTAERAETIGWTSGTRASSRMVLPTGFTWVWGWFLTVLHLSAPFCTPIMPVTAVPHPVTGPM